MSSSHSDMDLTPDFIREEAKAVVENKFTHFLFRIKSDRINTLKQRYDAFLEDDKKRKERNEYILEKLDKMCYFTAMVPVRLKSSTFNDRDVTYQNRPTQACNSNTDVTHSDQRYMHLDVPRKHNDEALVLQEISKKYILIPKIRSAYNDSTPNIKPKVDENVDWKSKYEILDKLKKAEKEQDNHETRLLRTEKDFVEKQYIDDENNAQYDKPLLEYRKEIPEKLPREEQIPYDLQSYAENNLKVENSYHYADQVDKDYEQKNSDQNKIDNVNDEQNNIFNDSYDHYDHNDTVYDQTDIKNTVYDNNDIKNAVHDKSIFENGCEQVLLNDKTKYLQAKTCDLNTHEKTENVESMHLQSQVATNVDKHDKYCMDPEINIKVHETQDNHTAHEQLDIQEVENNINSQKQIHMDKGEVSPVFNVNASDEMNEINEVPIGQDYLPTVADVGNPIDPVNVQDFTPHGSGQLIDGVNVNPEPSVLLENNALTNHYDPVVQTGENILPEETFNTEQSEGFYNEQTENYDYTGQGDTEYAPNQTYPQNEEYGYYEGAQTEPAYAEVNDSEETTQHYDQNYEQQYGTAYDQQGYEQEGYQQEYAQGYEQQGYVEPQQQYEAVEKTQQDVEKIQSENQDMTPQYVEQQLDDEQGYTETQNEKSGIINVEKHEDVQTVPLAVNQKLQT